MFNCHEYNGLAVVTNLEGGAESSSIVSLRTFDGIRYICLMMSGDLSIPLATFDSSGICSMLNPACRDIVRAVLGESGSGWIVEGYDLRCRRCNVPLALASHRYGLCDPCHLKLN